MGRRRKEKGPTFSEALVPFRMASSTTIPNTSRSKASTAMGSPFRAVSGLEAAIRMKSASRGGTMPHLACVPHLDPTSKTFYLVVRDPRSMLSADAGRRQHPERKPESTRRKRKATDAK